jgi:hypothetical protein
MSKIQRFNIPHETLLEAKKCTTGHACLAQEDYQLCDIRITTERQARMLCGKESDCPYSTRLGNKSVCACPVRHAIYSKYGV